MRLPFLTLAGALAACFTLASTPAQAAFAGAWDASHWTAAGDGSALFAPDGATLTLTSADFAPEESPGPSTLDEAITLAAATTISFDWAYLSDDISSSSDPFGYAINAVWTPLSQDAQAGFVEQDGHVTLRLDAGDVFSFQARSLDSVFGASTTTVSHFDAVATVAEPAQIATLLAGLSLLAAIARRRRER